MLTVSSCVHGPPASVLATVPRVHAAQRGVTTRSALGMLMPAAAGVVFASGSLGCNKSLSFPRVRLVFCRTRRDGDLPSDEEMAESLNARMPEEVRLATERAVKAEATLRRADEQIANIGIDLEEEDRRAKQLAQQLAILPPLPSDGPPAAFCLLGGSASVCETQLLFSLESMLPPGRLQVLPLEDLRDSTAKEFAAALEMCEVLVFCSALRSPSSSLVETGVDARAIELDACKGLSALLDDIPETVRRIVLLTDSLAESSTCPMELFFARAMRERSPNASPLRFSIVRATIASEGDNEMVLAQPVEVISKMPAMVKDAVSGLRSAYVGGIVRSVQLMMGSQDNEETQQLTSPGAAAKALQFALRRGLDVPELTITGGAPADWDELLLAIIGPEIWRMPVEDARRMRSWLHGWVEFNYCRGANQGGAAMKKAGLKTPVEVRLMAKGACIKFVPSGSRTPGAGFDGLLEGGLEILVDDEAPGRPARLRVRRCAYGWRAKPREGSERAILSRLQRDWKLTQKFRS